LSQSVVVLKWQSGANGGLLDFFDHFQSRAISHRTDAHSTRRSLQEYIAQLVETRIEKPGENDLISKPIVDQYKTGPLEKEDIANLSYLVLVAGNEAMLSLIALVNSSSHELHERTLMEALGRSDSSSISEKAGGAQGRSALGEACGR
jgi:cytochrome P450